MRILILIVIAAATAPLRAQNRNFDPKLQEEFDKAVTSSVRPLINECAEARVLQTPSIQRPLMLWNLFDHREPYKERIYRMLYDAPLPDDQRQMVPRDQGKPSTLVLVTFKKSANSGFYLSGADAYTATYTACFVSWSERVVIGKASFTSKPPSTIDSLISMKEVHDRQFGKWIAGLPKKTENPSIP